MSLLNSWPSNSYLEVSLWTRFNVCFQIIAAEWDPLLHHSFAKMCLKHLLGKCVPYKWLFKESCCGERGKAHQKKNNNAAWQSERSLVHWLQYKHSQIMHLPDRNEQLESTAKDNRVQVSSDGSWQSQQTPPKGRFVFPFHFSLWCVNSVLTVVRMRTNRTAPQPQHCLSHKVSLRWCSG